MKFIDTHSHLNIIAQYGKAVGMVSESDLNSIETIVKNALDVGVSKIINIGADLYDCKNGLILAKKFEPVFFTLGIHPTECNLEHKEKLSEFKKLLDQYKTFEKLVGIGEIGLDFYHEGLDKDSQEYGLLLQLELAIKHDLAISFHIRDASDHFLKLIEPYQKQIKRAVIHCFSQDLNFAKVVVDWGFFLGIGGTLTYPKNLRLVEVVGGVGLESLVLETDAPFLPIQSRRGKINYPDAVVDVAREIAKIKSIDLETVADQTTANASLLFGID